MRTEPAAPELRGIDVESLAQLLRETSEHHAAFEAAAPPHHWWDWYAAYALARRTGSTEDQAVSAAELYMAQVKKVEIPEADHRAL